MFYITAALVFITKNDNHTMSDNELNKAIYNSMELHHKYVGIHIYA